MVKYRDLLGIEEGKSNELLLPLDPKIIPNGYLSVFADMEKITGESPLVRETIYSLLQDAQKLLQKKNVNYTLFVTYGFRSLEIQVKNFLTQLAQTTNIFFSNPVDLYEEVHRFIAVPSVAGHPSGGAVDLVIKDIRSGRVIDFGAEQYDFDSKDCYVFSSNISKIGANNRALLREIMTSVGFAPFDGEWWHFSYGDKEWAYYYKHKKSIYQQLNLLDYQGFRINGKLSSSNS